MKLLLIYIRNELFEKEFCRAFLRAARKELNLTQEEVSRLIGIERSAVAHYENGTFLPHAGNLQKICENLQIPIEKIFK